MLLDTIKRHDTRSVIKLVSIEGIASVGRKVPPQIHSVPALVLDNKSIMFGKQVFDYLLLPGRGVLLTQAPKPSFANDSAGISMPSEDGPAAYVLGSAHSDQFSMIEGESHNGLFDRSYVWTSIHDDASMTPSDLPIQEETRTKKELPDINAIREQRQLDLQQQNDLNISALPPPTSTRV